MIQVQFHTHTPTTLLSLLPSYPSHIILNEHTLITTKPIDSGAMAEGVPFIFTSHFNFEGRLTHCSITATQNQNVILALSRALHRIRSTPPRIIASPATRLYLFIFVAFRLVSHRSVSQNLVVLPLPLLSESHHHQASPSPTSLATVRTPFLLSQSSLHSTGSITLLQMQKSFSFDVNNR